MTGSMENYQHFLFNFSSSYSGGGLKRLMAFVTWFHDRGGAHFIVNRRLEGKLSKYGANTYHFVEISSVKKFLNIQTYVEDVIKDMGECEFYYSYNVPMKRFKCQKSWFHLSNVLPLCGSRGLNIPIRRRVELWWLGKITRTGVKYCNFVSAESEFSVGLLKTGSMAKPVVSTNGADVELKMAANSSREFDNLAVVVGTYFHKNIEDSYRAYLYLKQNYRDLRLMVIGDESTVPEQIKKDESVTLKGVLSHDDTLRTLSRARFYIGTSRIENSWNAASEGAILAKQSVVSKIPPHVELLEDASAELIDLESAKTELMFVSRENVNLMKLKTWDEVIAEMTALSQGG